MADEKAEKATPKGEAKANAAAEKDEYPNKARYEDGYVFNLPLNYWTNKTEDEVRRTLKDAGNSEEDVDSHVELIKEALAFHEAEFKTEEAPKPAGAKSK